MELITAMVEKIMLLRRKMKQWRKVVSVLAAVVVFVTTYSLILPAVTLDKSDAEDLSGISVEAAAPSDAADPAAEKAAEPTSESAAQEAAPEDPIQDPAETAEKESTEMSEDVAEDADAQADQTVADDGTAAETDADTADASGTTVLTVEGKDYVVTASFDASAGLPADVRMSVEEIEKDTKEYKTYYDQALAAMQKESKETVDLTYARFFDITFLSGDAEVEPTGPVAVNIKYDKAIEEVKKDDVNVLHFDDKKKDDPKLMEIETDGKKDKVEEISFETDGFSVYGIVGTELVGKITLPGSDETYEVTVTFGEDANIPENVHLNVEAFLEGSPEYQKAKEALIAAKRSEDEEFDENTLGFAALDISIVDNETGEKVEPAEGASVKVSFKMNVLPEGETEENLAQTMEIQHLNESSGSSVVETVAGVEDVNVENGTATADFSVESFSTFTITFNAQAVTGYTGNRRAGIGAGDYVIYTSGNTHYALNHNLIRTSTVTEGNRQVTASSADVIWTFTQANGGYRIGFTDATGTYYLRANNTSLSTTNDPSQAAIWNYSTYYTDLYTTIGGNNYYLLNNNGTFSLSSRNYSTIYLGGPMTPVTNTVNNAVAVTVHYVDINGTELTPSSGATSGFRATTGTTYDMATYGNNAVIENHTYLNAHYSTVDGQIFTSMIGNNGTSEGSLASDTNYCVEFLNGEEIVARQEFEDANRTVDVYLVYYQNDAFQITDSIITDGCLNVVYNGEVLSVDNPNGYTCRWSKGDSENDVEVLTRRKVMGDLYNIPEEGGFIVNVAVDGGARKWYQAEILDSNGEPLKDGNGDPIVLKYQVPYYNQVLNNSFEQPSRSTFIGNQYVSNSNPNVIWKSTGTDPGGQNRNIEILTGLDRYGNRPASPDSLNGDIESGFGVRYVPDGNRFAELNAEAAGALYQDVLTIPGSQKFWSLYHRARQLAGYGTPNANVEDQMYVIAMSTELAEKYDVTTSEKVLALLAHMDEEEFDDIEIIRITTNNRDGGVAEYLTSGRSVNSPTVAFGPSNVSNNTKTNWCYYSGNYSIPEGQYLTRFFFVAGLTQATQDGYGNGDTIGNFVDAINVGDIIPPPNAGQATVEVKKTVVGIGDDEIGNYATRINLTFSNVLNVTTGNAGDFDRSSNYDLFAATDDGYEATWYFPIDIPANQNSGIKLLNESSPTGTTKTDVIEGFNLASTSYEVTITHSDESTPYKTLTGTGTAPSAEDLSQIGIQEKDIVRINYTNTYEAAVGSITFNKVNDRNVAVPGAVFAFYTDNSCTTAYQIDGVAVTAQSVDDGTVSFSNIPCGTYYMKETTVPAGYLPNDTVYEVEIKNANSTMKPIIDGTVGSAITQIANKESTSVSVTKVWKDTDGNTITAPNGASVTFNLYAGTTESAAAASETIVKSITLDSTVDQNGESAAWTATFNDLPKYSINSGEATELVYVVKESPAYPGYDVKYGADGNGSYAKDGESITNVQSTMDINILKVDKADGTTPLTKAKFILKKYSSDAYQNVEKSWQETQVSAEEATKGQLKFEGLSVGYYELVETKSPDGYVKTTTSPRFEVRLSDSEQGGLTIVYTDQTNGMVSYDAANNTFIVKNEAGKSLPNTGGPGTLPYTLSGLALMLASAMMYGFRMRRRERRLN